MVTIVPDDDIVLAPSLRRVVVVVAKHRAFRIDRSKLHYRLTRDGVQWSLFDLSVDPDEKIDIAARQPEVLRGLQERLYSWMTEDGSVVEGSSRC